jgi:hypothetical protein
MHVRGEAILGRSVRFCRHIEVEVRRNNARSVTFELSFID